MALTITPVFAGTDFKTWTVQSDTDDVDTGTITHGFGAAPADVSLVPLLASAYAAEWIATVNASNIVLAKTSAAATLTVGSVKVVARRPHSIGA